MAKNDLKELDKNDQEAAINIPVSFWQQLLALMLQLFGAAPGARDQTHLISQLRTMHNSLYGDDSADSPELRDQKEAMKPENRDKYEADEAARVAEEHRAAMDTKAVDTAKRYSTAGVDNSAREAQVVDTKADELTSKAKGL